jgi:Domain of unknown function (DUF2382)
MESLMAVRTITALYDDASGADRARLQLLELGLAESDVSVIDRATGTAEPVKAPRHRGLWESIKHFLASDEDRDTYDEGLRRGGYLLTARVDEPYIERAIVIVEQSDAVHLDDRREQWRAEGWEQPASPERPSAAEEGIGAVTRERQRVGKRYVVPPGMVRVRTYIIEERPHEDVRRRDESARAEEDVPRHDEGVRAEEDLRRRDEGVRAEEGLRRRAEEVRDEQVQAERRPPGQAAPAESGPLKERTVEEVTAKERTVETSEFSEEAGVAKETLSTEEVVVRTMRGEYTRGVDETVRRTEVDADESRAQEQQEAAKQRQAASSPEVQKPTPDDKPEERRPP